MTLKLEFSGVNATTHQRKDEIMNAVYFSWILLVTEVSNLRDPFLRAIIYAA